MNSMRIILLFVASLFSCGVFASDLQARSIVLSPYAEANMYTAGDHVSAHWECVNSGADITETFYIAIYVDGRLVDRGSKSGLKRDEVVSGNYSLGELTVGSHSFTVIFDSENAIEETSEGNNVSSAMISVKDPYDPQSGSGGSSGNPDNPEGGYGNGGGEDDEPNNRSPTWFCRIDGSHVAITGVERGYSGNIVIPPVIYIPVEDIASNSDPDEVYRGYESPPKKEYKGFIWIPSMPFYEEYSWVSNVICSAYVVESIDSHAFKFEDEISSVTMPETVTSIGASAFWRCSGLTDVNIPNSVTSIGEGAFQGCSGLRSITIPDCITEIGKQIFDGCRSLETVIIGNSVTNIGDSAFSGCSGLVSVTIGDGVISIGDWAFCGCNGLTSVTIGDGVISIGDGAFWGCNGLTSVTIPSSVKRIGEYAFAECSGLVKATIAVADISDYAFAWCSNLTVVVISGHEARVGEYAFARCANLKDVTICNGVKNIGHGAFRYCHSIDSITIPDSVTSIAGAFFGCSGLKNVVIGDGLETIGEDAFYDCGLTSVTIPSNIKTICKDAFGWCTELELVLMPRHLQETNGLDAKAFYMATPTIIFYDDQLPDLGNMAKSTIVFDANGGSSSVDSKESFSGYNIGKLPNATKSGCKFIGWYTDKEDGEKISNETIVGESMTLYAHYEELKLITITFDANGGEIVEGCRAIYYESAIGYLPDAERVGFSFVGWYTQPEGGIQISSTTRMYDACTLYAHWDQILGPTRFSGDADWTQESDGLWRSGHIEDFGSSTAIMDVVGPCMISFKWKTSSEIDYDGLHFYIDGEEYEYWISGEWGDEWDSVNVEVSTVGVVELKWEYAKDVSDSGGEDCGWIKDIDWTPIGLIPTINGDDGATVTGDAESGYTIKPSGGKKDVVVTVPEGVAPEKVTVEVSATVETVTANGATVKVMKGEYDIAEHLDLEEVTQDGVINLASARVKDEIVKEALDTENGATVSLGDTESPSLTTSETKPGLTYTLREGTTLDGMADGDSMIGDGNKWTPTITVKGGASGFYSIKVEK